MQSSEETKGRLAGKKVLVTAAGAGIGRAICEAFSAEGASIIATDINQAALDEVAQATGCAVELLDVTNRDAIVSLAQAHKDVCVLMNVAGWVANGTILDTAREDWDRALSINLTSMYETCRAFLPAMLEAGSGTIVNVSSVASSIIAAPNRFSYGTTKAGIVGLTKAIAADYVTAGIRCNAICPGTIDTPSLQDRIAQGDTPVVEARAAFLARQPGGRFGTAREVAMLALYLASDEASFTTGTVNVIDGGWSNT